MAVAVCFCAGVLLSRDDDKNALGGDEEDKDEGGDEWRDVDAEKWRIQMQSRSKRGPGLEGELWFACQSNGRI